MCDSKSEGVVVIGCHAAGSCVIYHYSTHKQATTASLNCCLINKRRLRGCPTRNDGGRGGFSTQRVAAKKARGDWCTGIRGIRYTVIFRIKSKAKEISTVVCAGQSFSLVLIGQTSIRSGLPADLMKPR